MTMTSRFRRALVAASLVLLTAAAGCGGGGGERDALENAESAGLSVCRPAGAAAGEKVTCPVGEDFKEACTLFVGETAFEAGDEADAQHYALNDDGTVAFLLPAGLTADPEVYFCCGDCEKTRQNLEKAFSVIVEGAKTSEGTKKTGASKSTAPSSGGEEILPDTPASVPSGPGGGSTSGKEPDGDGDGVPDTIDSCKDTAKGSSVNSVGCSPEQQSASTPPSAPSGQAAAISQFLVQPAGDPGVYGVTWKVTNAVKLAVWGNILNRTADDAKLVASQRCAKTGGRYLWTKKDGHDWVGNERDFLKNVNSVATGVECQGDDPNTKAGCKYQAPGSSYFLHEPLEARGVFAYQPMEMKTVMLVDPVLMALPSEPNPSCRVDLAKDGAPVAAGTLYTKSHVSNGTVCLQAQGGDGSWKVACKSVAGQKPELSLVNVEVSDDAPVLKLSLHYKNVVGGLSVTGCKKGGSPSASGAGDYTDECPITSDTTAIGIEAKGLGGSDKRAYTLEFKDRKFEIFQVLGSLLPVDDPGNMTLSYKVSRSYDLKQDGKVVDTGEAPWAKRIKFHGQYEIDGATKIDPEIEIKTKSDASGKITAKRDPEHAYWYGSVYGFEDNQYGGTSETVSHPIPIHFDRELKPNGSTGSQPCLGILAHTFIWKGRNIKSVTVSGAQIAGGTLPKEVKGEQGGEITIMQVVSPAENMSMEFRWLVVDLWGKTWDLAPVGVQKSIPGWSCH